MASFRADGNFNLEQSHEVGLSHDNLVAQTEPPMALPPILTTNLRLPVVAAPLFIISHPALVIAQCKSGIVGSFPALNARPESQLDEWLAEITETLASHNAAHPDRPAPPFAVNQIVHASNKRLQHDLTMCVKYKVPIVISSLGAVPEVNDAIHSYGGIVLHDVINVRHANSAIRKGADGLIAVASGAGGHAGTLSPFALVQEIREWFDGPLLLSGAIATGGAVLAAQAMGADLAYIGSPFIATEEARATDDYKRMIVDSAASDIIYSNYFTGIHGNYLKGSIRAVGMDPDKLPEADPSKMDFENAAAGPKAWKEIWGSGQGIGAVKAIEPVATLVERLDREYRAARTRICNA
jgi:nitronate monooxygenase